MKISAIASLLFAGAALAVPLAAEKRGAATEVVVTTVWTTTTVFVDGPTAAAFAEKRPRTSSSASSSSSAPSPPPSSAVAAPSVAPPAAPSAEPVAEPVAAPKAAQPVAAPAAAAPASGSGSGPSGTGEATYYTVSNGVPGSCGDTKTDNDAVVALAVGTMGNGANSNKNPLCGKTISIQGETEVVTAVVYDTCEGCAPGDVDMSPSLFKKAFPHGDGRVKGVKWWVS